LLTVYVEFPSLILLLDERLVATKSSLMGLLTLVLIAVIVLVIIGIGAGTFFSGLWTGAQKVGSNPVVQNLTAESKQFAKDAAQNATAKIENATIGSPKK
jgi:hypothetical protein